MQLSGNYAVPTATQIQWSLELIDRLMGNSFLVMPGATMKIAALIYAPWMALLTY